MSDFVPVNSLEIQLRALLQDRNTPSWNFHPARCRADLDFRP